MDGPNNQDLSSADTAGSAASNAASAGPAGSRFLDTSGIEEGRQNQRGCRITRLSNELFLMIIDRLHDDIVAKLCLRRVCRRFRHVLVRNCRGGVWPECGCAGCWKYIKEEYKDLDLESKDTLRARLRRDTLCSHCLARCDLPDHPMSAPWRGCKFSSYLQEQLYCSGCNCRHPCRAFSDAESLKPWHKRICIGREGVLRICEHRHVTWADIEAHMAGLLMERRAGTASRDLRLNCDHPKHRYRHSLDPDSELASLRLFPEMLLLPTQRQDTITLKFSIQQHLHSVLDLDTRSRFEGDQVRLMFGKHHPSADDSFVFNQWEVPSSIEQRCFADPRCRCISHELAEANTVRANMTASDRDSTSTSDDSNVNDAVCPIEATVNDNIWGFPVNKRVGHWSSSWDHRPLIYEACNVVKCFLSAPTQNKQCVQAKYKRSIIEGSNSAGPLSTRKRNVFDRTPPGITHLIPTPTRCHTTQTSMGPCGPLAEIHRAPTITACTRRSIAVQRVNRCTSRSGNIDDQHNLLNDSLGPRMDYFYAVSRTVTQRGTKGDHRCGMTQSVGFEPDERRTRQCLSKKCSWSDRRKLEVSFL